MSSGKRAILYPASLWSASPLAESYHPDLPHPLLVYIGGKNTLAAVKAHGLPAIVEANGHAPYVLVSPQSPAGAGGWGSAAALQALAAVG